MEGEVGEEAEAMILSRRRVGGSEGEGEGADEPRRPRSRPSSEARTP